MDSVMTQDNGVAGAVGAAPPAPAGMMVRPGLDTTAYEPRNLNQAVQMATVLAKSGLLGKVEPNPETVLFLMARGRELGFSTAQSIAAFHIMDGQPSLSARAQVALCQRRRDVCEYIIPVEWSATSATWETKRVGHPQPTRFTYTIEEARQMGLLKPARQRADGSPGEPTSWEKQPATMLRWRAATGLIGMIYSDLILGLYDPEEYREMAAAQNREAVDASFAPVAPQVIEGTLAQASETFGAEPDEAPDEDDTSALAELAAKPPEVPGVDRPFREGDPCPWCAAMTPPIGSKYTIAKGGPHKGELQCRGHLRGRYFNHPPTLPPGSAPEPPAPVAAATPVETPAAVDLRGDVDQSDIPF